jgi:hypothetical protein
MWAVPSKDKILIKESDGAHAHVYLPRQLGKKKLFGCSE